MKVAILGTVPNTKMLAPFEDEGYEIWVCSPGNRGGVIPRVTRWFELHGVIDMYGPENNEWRGPYFDWLNKQSFPVYMQEPNDLCLQAKVFPRDDILKEFGRFGRINMTSSIAWMIAYAMYLKTEEIGVYGVDMAATEEAYGGQKTGCLNLLWLADQRGIKVEVPLESCLACPPPLYGYAESTRMGRKLVVKELEIKSALANHREVVRVHTNLISHCEGALETIQYIRRTFVDGERDAEIDIDAMIPEAPVMKASGYPAGSVVTPTRVPDIDPSHPQDYQPGPGGLLVPRANAKGNSGDHHALE